MQQGGAPSGGRRQTAMLTCPKSMVGRVIGRDGDTIKALQTFTGALIQIDQTSDPTKIAISGNPHSLNMALSMVHDIVRGTFKGFALLRQATGHGSRGPQALSNKPVYAPGYGLIPPSQLYGGTDVTGAPVVGPPPAAAAAMGLVSTTPAAAAAAAAAAAGAAGAAGGGGGMLTAAAGAGPLPRMATGGLAGAGGGGMLAAAAGGGPGPAGGGYPQLLSAAGPQQFVVGMQPLQPLQMTGTPLPGPVYNVISAPGYTGPVFFSPMEYGNPGAAGGASGMPVGATGVLHLSTGTAQLAQPQQQIQYFTAGGGIGIGGGMGGGGIVGGGGMVGMGGIGMTAVSTAAADQVLYGPDQSAASSSLIMAAAGGAAGRLFQRQAAAAGGGGGGGGGRHGGGGGMGRAAGGGGGPSSAADAATVLLVGGGGAAGGGPEMYESPASAGAAAGGGGGYMLTTGTADTSGAAGGSQHAQYYGSYGVE